MTEVEHLKHRRKVDKKVLRKHQSKAFFLEETAEAHQSGEQTSALQVRPCKHAKPDAEWPRHLTKGLVHGLNMKHPRCRYKRHRLRGEQRHQTLSYRLRAWRWSSATGRWRCCVCSCRPHKRTSSSFR